MTIQQQTRLLSSSSSWNESVGFPLQFRWCKGSFRFTNIISSTALHSIPKLFSHSSRLAPDFTFSVSAVGTHLRDTAHISPDIVTRGGERKQGNLFADFWHVSLEVCNVECVQAQVPGMFWCYFSELSSYRFCV